MANTFQNSAQVLSIGVFFSLIIVGLSSTLPSRLLHGLTANGVPLATAQRISHLPPVSSLFAAFLGYNPMQKMLGGTLNQLGPTKAAYITGHSFFPGLISGSFQSGLREAFYFAAGACVLAAGASWLRGKKYVHGVSPVMAELAVDRLVEEETAAAEGTLASFEALLPMGVTEDGAE